MADDGDRVIEAFRKAAVLSDAAALDMVMRLDGIWVMGRRKHATHGKLQCTVIVDWQILKRAREPFDHLKAAVDECEGKLSRAMEAVLS